MKILKKIKWNDIRLILILMILIGLYLFANQRSEAREIESVEVKFFGDGDHFITSQNVNNLLIQSFPKAFNINKSSIDLNSLESGVQGNEMVRRADVSVTVDGRLVADVWQRRAVGRVLNEGESFYIDSEGIIMPLSSNYTARVPIVVGKVDESNSKALTNLLKEIDEDDFLKKSITGITIDANQKIEMRSRDQDFKILFGSFDQSTKKFENYKAFMNYASKDSVLIGQYKTINLKFTQQVVCTK